MQSVIRRVACWLLLLALQQSALAMGAGHCATTLSDEQTRYLEACLARGAQCTDYWPGHPEDLNDCARVQKWLTRAIAMPQGVRGEIFGPVPQAAADSVQPALAADPAPAPAWKSLPRSQDSAAPRAVAASVPGATAADYAGASSQLDPEQARAAGMAFWTGQMLQIAGTIAEAKRAPVIEPRVVAPPAAAVASRNEVMANAQRGAAGSGAAPAAVPSPATRAAPVPVAPPRPYKANATACIALSGNQLANNCSRGVWITFCVLNPRQTKNFFDSSEAFECPKGGLESISGNGRNGLVWHGWVMFYACYADDIATMKTQFHGTEPRPAAPGTLAGQYTGQYHGLCGGPGADGRMELGGALYAK